MSVWSADFQENYNALGCQPAPDNTTSGSLLGGVTSGYPAGASGEDMVASTSAASENTTSGSLLGGVTSGYPAGASGEDMVASTSASSDALVGPCLRETSLLYLLLTLGTAWLGLSLYNFTKTYVLPLARG